VPTITGPTLVCKGVSGVTYTTEPSMTGYTWSISAGGTITAGLGTNTITVAWNTAGAQTVSVNYTNANNCTAASPTIYNVTVDAPTPVISGPTSVHMGTTATYTTPLVTGHTYIWSVVYGTYITCDLNCIIVNWPYFCDLQIPGQVTVTETDTSTGCTQTVTLFVTVNP